MNIPWDLLFDAFLTTWILSVICCLAVVFVHGQPEGLKGRAVQWITWPIPATLVLLLMLLGFLTDLLELLLLPWEDLEDAGETADEPKTEDEDDEDENQ